ncbi:hypothetical protein MHU86_4801 [Fragilaria crotonensis]|nr:hypothetical protein MHU86_4801 [Fragilaria crotonensis]
MRYSFHRSRRGGTGKYPIKDHSHHRTAFGLLVKNVDSYSSWTSIYGRFKSFDIRTECGIEMIKYFRHEVYGNTKVGQLLLLQLQASQIESDFRYNSSKDPSIQIGYLTPTWILSMRQFLSNHNIRITLTDTFQIALQGKDDQYIMDLKRLQGYTTRQQKDLNLVRLYLQVTTLAELVDTSENGKIATWAFEGTRPTSFTDNKAWPRQERTYSPATTSVEKVYLGALLRYDRFWRTPPRPTLRDVKEIIATTTATGPKDVKEK